MRVDFAPPFIDNDVISEVEKTLRSGWITSGEKVKSLEENIKLYTQTKACIAVNSWTSGAILALKWLNLKPNDEVIVPALTYCATALAVILAGAKPVMVDTTNDFTIDCEKISDAINENTKAIIPVDYAGIPCDYIRINEIINSKQVRDIYTPNSDNQKKLGRILLLSDSAHSLGAKICNQHIASLVDIAVFSFHAVKNITAAEGGMICLNLPSNFDIDYEHQWFKIMSLNGQTKDAFTKTRLNSWQYDVRGVGLKINLPDVCAAIALSQFRRYDFLLQERKKRFEQYNACLKNYDWAILPFDTSNEDIEIAYHLYPLRIKNISVQQRNEIIQILAQQNIATNVHYLPLPELTVFKNLGYQISDYPIAKTTFEHEITLPLYPQLTEQQVNYVLENLILAVEKVTKK